MLSFYIVHARVMTAANYKEAKRAKRQNRIFTVCLLIFSFLITIVPTTGLITGQSGWMSSVVTILGALTVSATAIQYILNLDENAATHKAAAAEYSRLRRRLEILALESDLSAPHIRRTVELHLEQLSTCAALSPMVEEDFVLEYHSHYSDNQMPTNVVPLEKSTSAHPNA